MTALALLILAAEAHVPHDAIDAMGAPGDLGDGPWVLLAAEETFTSVYRATDGRTWTSTLGDPLVDALIGAAVLDDGTVVLAGAARLWFEDAGGWVSVSAEVPVTMVAGGAGLVFGSPEGLYAASPEGVRRLTPGLVSHVQPGPDGACAIVEGELWREGAAWQNLGAPTPPVACSSLGASTVAVGADRSVWRWEGAWRPCGVVPATADVVRVAAHGDTVLVATATGQVFRTTPACDAWADVGSPLRADYGGSGAATGPADAARALQVHGDRWAHAGWAGFALADAGRWTEPPTLAPDYTRGIVVEAGSTVHLASYAAGVLSFDGAWRAPDHGLGAPNLQALVQRPDGELVAVAGHALYASGDGWGWRAWDAPAAFVTGVAALEEEVWAFADPTTGPAVAVTRDGERWESPALLLDALGDSLPSGAAAPPWQVDRVVVGGTPTRVLGRQGDAWVPLYVDPLATGLVGPVLRGRTLVFADSAGVHQSDDGVVWTTWTGLGSDSAQSLGALDDELWLATRTGRLWRSTDTWRDTGLVSPAPVRSFGRLPDGGVILGTQDGTFLADEGVPRWAPFQRVDDTSPYLACIRCDVAYQDPLAGMSTLTALGIGTAEVTLRGEELRVHGVVQGGEAEVWLDGELAGHIGGHAPAVGEIWRSPAVPWGWHTLAVRGVRPGVSLDAVEAGEPSAVGGCSASGVGPQGDPGAGASLVALAGASAALLARGRRGPRRRGLGPCTTARPLVGQPPL